MIDKVNPFGGPADGNPGVQPGNRETEAFRALFEKALEGSRKTTSTAVSAAGMLEEVPSSRCVECSPEQLQGKTDELLDRLDGYALRLGNPSLSLKALEEDADSLQKQAEELFAFARSAEDADQELKSIAMESAATAAAESFKFRRGDYL